MSKLTYIKFFVNWRDAFDKLSDEAAGRLIKGILRYSSDGTEPEGLDGGAEVAWALMRGIITSNINAQTADKRHVTSAENGKKGGRPRRAVEAAKPNQVSEKTNLVSEEPNSSMNKNRGKMNKKNESGRMKDSCAGELDLLIDGFTDDQELRVALNEFVKMRKAAKKAPTAHALKLLLNELTNLSSDTAMQIGIVNQSTKHGWQSFYAIKPMKDAAGFSYVPIDDPELDSILK